MNDNNRGHYKSHKGHGDGRRHRDNYGQGQGFKPSSTFSNFPMYSDDKAIPNQSAFEEKKHSDFHGRNRYRDNEKQGHKFKPHYDKKPYGNNDFGRFNDAKPLPVNLSLINVN